VLLASTLAALTLAAFLEAKRVDIVTHDLRPAGAPQALRLVQISDLHLSHFGPHEQTQVKTHGKGVFVVGTQASRMGEASALKVKGGDGLVWTGHDKWFFDFTPERRA
jgi:hypothetical protein